MDDVREFHMWTDETVITAKLKTSLVKLIIITASCRLPALSDSLNAINIDNILLQINI